MAMRCATRLSPPTASAYAPQGRVQEPLPSRSSRTGALSDFWATQSLLWGLMVPFCSLRRKSGRKLVKAKISVAAGGAGAEAALPSSGAEEEEERETAEEKEGLLPSTGNEAIDQLQQVKIHGTVIPRGEVLEIMSLPFYVDLIVWAMRVGKKNDETLLHFMKKATGLEGSMGKCRVPPPLWVPIVTFSDGAPRAPPRQSLVFVFRADLMKEAAGHLLRWLAHGAVNLNSGLLLTHMEGRTATLTALLVAMRDVEDAGCTLAWGTELYEWLLDDWASVRGSGAIDLHGYAMHRAVW
ncbi:unnamed protein product [Symbiodinium microadriaticum]|nr:unnamed protein product [Symbiodinium microadriaticum]